MKIKYHNYNYSLNFSNYLPEFESQKFLLESIEIKPDSQENFNNFIYASDKTHHISTSTSSSRLSNTPITRASLVDHDNTSNSNNNGNNNVNLNHSTKNTPNLQNPPSSNSMHSKFRTPPPLSLDVAPRRGPGRPKKNSSGNSAGMDTLDKKKRKPGGGRKKKPATTPTSTPNISASNKDDQSEDEDDESQETSSDDESGSTKDNDEDYIDEDDETKGTKDFDNEVPDLKHTNKNKHNIGEDIINFTSFDNSNAEITQDESDTTPEQVETNILPQKRKYSKTLPSDYITTKKRSPISEEQLSQSLIPKRKYKFHNHSWGPNPQKLQARSSEENSEPLPYESTNSPKNTPNSPKPNPNEFQFSITNNTISPTTPLLKDKSFKSIQEPETIDDEEDKRLKRLKTDKDSSFTNIYVEPIPQTVFVNNNPLSPTGKGEGENVTKRGPGRPRKNK